jgi:hypothetical protein
MNCIHYIFLLSSLIINYLTNSVVHSIVFTKVASSMPIKTRSMTKSGLQDITNSVPTLSTHPTCYNVITNASDSTLFHDNTDSSIVMPDLSRQLPLLVLPSAYDSSSTSSLEVVDFENSKLPNLELSNSNAVSTSYILNPSQIFMMESDCQDSKLPPAPNESSSPHNEILKMLTAIPSCMLAGHQDLQNQQIHHDLKLEIELQRVRDENAKLRHELRQEFSATLG